MDRILGRVRRVGTPSILSQAVLPVIQELESRRLLSAVIDDETLDKGEEPAATDEVVDDGTSLTVKDAAPDDEGLADDSEPVDDGVMYTLESTSADLEDGEIRTLSDDAETTDDGGEIIDPADGTVDDPNVIFYSMGGVQASAPDISFDNGVLTITGTDANDTVSVIGRGGKVVVKTNGHKQGVAYDGVTQINVDGGAGDDRVVIRAFRISANVTGGEGNDTLIGGKGDDSLAGGEGDDKLRGRRGADLLSGGGGNDRLRGGAGDDSVTGGDGTDKVFGGRDIDQLLGGNGRDWLHGGQSDDWMTGGAGKDSIFGDAGSDQVNDIDAMLDANKFDARHTKRLAAPGWWQSVQNGTVAQGIAEGEPNFDMIYAGPDWADWDGAVDDTMPAGDLGINPDATDQMIIDDGDGTDPDSDMIDGDAARVDPSQFDPDAELPSDTPGEEILA
jgi:hypothetical protein